MILAFDVGNTNIVIGCIENDGKIRNTVRMRTEISATSAEYAIKILDMLSYMGVSPEDFEGAILSSVVPPVTGYLSQAVQKVIRSECMIVGPGVKTGMNVKIDDPGTLGADLVVGGVAAIAFYGVPAIVIDMGTATTITAVDKNRAFLGGAIIPGVKLSLAALASGTSLLPDIYITRPDKAIGTNTVDCMRSGAVLGTASMIDGMIDRMEREIGEPCRIIATGGLAPAVVPCCTHEIVCDDDLLLKGLWAIYRKNRK